MASYVENRKCKCGARYRSKVRRGKDTKMCPGCGKDNSRPPAPAKKKG